MGQRPFARLIVPPVFKKFLAFLKSKVYYPVISGFRREVDENCALLDYDATSSGNFLQTFRDNLSVLSSGVKNIKNPEFFPFWDR